MASPNPGSTKAAEGDRSAGPPSGSSKDAIQNPAVDVTQNRELVPVKKQPVLNLSTVATGDNPEFAEIIQELDRVLLGRLKENKNVRPDSRIRKTDAQDSHMTFAELFAEPLQTLCEIPQARCFGLGNRPPSTGGGPNGGAREHEEEGLGTKALEEITRFVVAGVAPLVQRMKATTEPEKGG